MTQNCGKRPPPFTPLQWVKSTCWLWRSKTEQRSIQHKAIILDYNMHTVSIQSCFGMVFLRKGQQLVVKKWCWWGSYAQILLHLHSAQRRRWGQHISIPEAQKDHSRWYLILNLVKNKKNQNSEKLKSSNPEALQCWKCITHPPLDKKGEGGSIEPRRRFKNKKASFHGNTAVEIETWCNTQTSHQRPWC